MNKIAIAIKTKADNDSNLMTTLDNDFSYFKAGASATLPYATFHPVTENPEKAFQSDKIENGLWQFNVFSDSATEAGEIVELIKNTFDDTELNITDHNNLNCGRENARIIELEEEEKYYGIVEYRIYTEEI